MQNGEKPGWFEERLWEQPVDEERWMLVEELGLTEELPRMHDGREGRGMKLLEERLDLVVEQ